jgi:type IV secretion system protein TrbI
MSAAPDTAPDLSIRSAPRPVRRFSKKALAIVLGGASLLVLASVAIAMSPRDRGAKGPARELYSTANKPRAEGLSVLPAGYGQMPAERTVPELGPPLPGDLGEPILRAQREGRIRFEDAIAAGPGSSDEAALLRAAEAQARDAARAIEARESGLFFSVTGARGAAPAPAPPQGFAGAKSVDPFAALASLESGAGGTASDLDDPNRQGRRKEEFLGDVEDRSIYNPHRLETPVSPWQVMAGTVIPATLLTGVNSDLPGQVIAQVTEPVYDTVTGQYLLIPQGSRVIGRYDSVIAYGQSRALIVWNRIIMPNGSSIRIENLPAVDGRGIAGLADRVDYHTLRLFSAAALSSLICVGVELSDDDDEVARALRDAVQDGASRAGDEVFRRQLAVQPTITIRRGRRLRILVHQDLVLANH